MEWYEIQPYINNVENILANRKAGKIYSFDFKNKTGKYVSGVIDSNEPVDLKLQVSPKIELRVTYIIEKRDIRGIQLSKLNSDKSLNVINLSSLDWDGVLKLLSIFSSIDIASVASGSLILDESIVNDIPKLEKFLNTVVTDPSGRKKFEEVADNFGLLSPGDINGYSLRKTNTSLLNNLLNTEGFFNQYKNDKGIGKDEEVWEQFFKENEWLLGTDVIRVLKDRDVSEDYKADLPVESYDGFLDIVELKLPTAKFWTKDLCPNADLTKAIMQCMTYLKEYERRSNDHNKIKKIGVDILKPRITLIYGRSNTWDDSKVEQLRILNSSFHNIVILTYDHILLRASKLSDLSI